LIAALVRPSFLTVFVWALVPVAALVAFLYLGDNEVRGLGTNASYKPSEFGWATSYLASLIWVGIGMIIKALVLRFKRKTVA